LPFLLAATCPGFSDDPKVAKIQTATVTCASITGAFNTLAIMKGAGSLSSKQIASVDIIKEIVKPVCGVIQTSSSLIDLNALQAQLFELQKLMGGA
jgi:hypothetical protein